MIYAVIDTNVLVSALLSKRLDSATVKVVKALLSSRLVPVYNEEILSEYSDVLYREKFNFSHHLVDYFIRTIRRLGISSARVYSNETFPDPKDVVFYEVALSKEDAYLVTGNTKHFPSTPIVVTPAEMVEILEQGQRKGRDAGENFLK